MHVSDKHVEANDEYIDKAPTHVPFPKATWCIKMTRERTKLVKQTRSRQEIVNKRFK